MQSIYMTKFLKTNYNQTIAYNKIDGENRIVFLSGLKSDMTGQKLLQLKMGFENHHPFSLIIQVVDFIWKI